MTLSDLMLTLRSVCALVLCVLYSWLLSVCVVPEPVVMGMLWTKAVAKGSNCAQGQKMYFDNLPLKSVAVERQKLWFSHS